MKKKEMKKRIKALEENRSVVISGAVGDLLANADVRIRNLEANVLTLQTMLGIKPTEQSGLSGKVSMKASSDPVVKALQEAAHVPAGPDRFA